MSILIKGRKKPKSCLMCQFHGFGGYKDELIVCSLTGRSEGQLSNVPDCPLVEVPTPHGPLIDADEIIEVQMLDEMYEEWTLKTMSVAEYLAFAADMPPTIIEAEEGETHEIDRR